MTERGLEQEKVHVAIELDSKSRESAMFLQADFIYKKSLDIIEIIRKYELRHGNIK